MRSLRLYIWEGNGISDAFHDDGTLVVLAESPEQAREIALAARDESDRVDAENTAEWARYHKLRGTDAEIPPPGWLDSDRNAFDGSRAAIEREPDRVVEIDAPAVVAFNGGGYD